jgi:hypothetical protein
MQSWQSSRQHGTSPELGQCIDDSCPFQEGSCWIRRTWKAAVRGAVLGRGGIHAAEAQGDEGPASLLQHASQPIQLVGYW